MKINNIQKVLKSVNNEDVNELLSKKVIKQELVDNEALSVFQSVEAFLSEMKNAEINKEKTEMFELENSDLQNRPPVK